MSHTALSLKVSKYTKPKRNTLIGQYCVVQPFDRNTHAHELYDAFLLDKNGVDWDYLPYGPFVSRSAFLDWIDSTCCTDDPLFYTVCLGEHLEPAGMLSLLNIEPTHGKIEIGHVHFSPKMQQTAASTESIYLLMQMVFEDLNYRRIEWKCNNDNQRSKHCANRLGFTSEGVFRQHWIVKGRNRDTAWFSILDKEWPHVCLRIKRWLDFSNFDERGRQIKKLSEF